MGQNTALGSYFVSATQNDIDSLVRRRAGETKLGERVQVQNAVTPEQSTAKYVLIGIPEDIGVRANYGLGGTHTLWEPALRAILNIQDTAVCRGQDLLVLGAFDFSTWMVESEGMDVLGMRELVAKIDDIVYPVIERVIKAGKVPIIIGGGHNNAYPILKGAAKAFGKALNCINLDAHSDYRAIEGRHSGNPFRYARQDGYLENYAMVALHRPYNSQAVLEDIYAGNALHCSFYEDIFLEERISFHEAVAAALQHTKGATTGIELDLDSITHTLSSAATPVGISSLHARQYLRWCMQGASPAYIHIPEGAVKLRDGRDDGSTAKLIAYLVGDILSSE